MDPLFKVPRAFTRACTVCGRHHGGYSHFPPECLCGSYEVTVYLPNGHARCDVCLAQKPLTDAERAWLADNPDPGAGPDVQP